MAQFKMNPTTGAYEWVDDNNYGLAFQTKPTFNTSNQFNVNKPISEQISLPSFNNTSNLQAFNTNSPIQMNPTTDPVMFYNQDTTNWNSELKALVNEWKDYGYKTWTPEMKQRFLAAGGTQEQLGAILDDYEKNPNADAMFKEGMSGYQKGALAMQSIQAATGLANAYIGYESMQAQKEANKDTYNLNRVNVGNQALLAEEGLARMEAGRTGTMSGARAKYAGSLERLPEKKNKGSSGVWNGLANLGLNFATGGLYGATKGLAGYSSKANIKGWI